MPLQEAFFEALKKEDAQISLFLVSGIRLVGKIENYDTFTVMLTGPNGVSQLISKSAISTIQPDKPLAFKPQA